MFVRLDSSGPPSASRAPLPAHGPRGGRSRPLSTDQSGARPPERSEHAPRRPLSLRGNFCWSLVGNVIYAACQCGILMTISRLGSPEMLGQFALGLAVTTPVLAFGNLKAKGVQ